MMLAKSYHLCSNIKTFINYIADIIVFINSADIFRIEATIYFYYVILNKRCEFVQEYKISYALIRMIIYK